MCSEFDRMKKIGMTEHQWKELSKYFLDNGNRKLSTDTQVIIVNLWYGYNLGTPVLKPHR